MDVIVVPVQGEESLPSMLAGGGKQSRDLFDACRLSPIVFLDVDGGILDHSDEADSRY